VQKGTAELTEITTLNSETRELSIDQGFNLLKPSCFFIYHQVLHSKIIHGAFFALSVLYRSQNRQRLCFIHHKLIGFYNHGGSVYCVVWTDSLYKADCV
jgi:hypothetical protein